MLKGSWGRVAKKVAATCILTLGLVMIRPVNTQAEYWWSHWCPDPEFYCDAYWACMDNCDFQWTDCVIECVGYEEPYRSECEDDCITGWADCNDWCGSDCFYFCV